MELSTFDEASEALRAMVPSELGPLRTRPRRYGLKAWYGRADRPEREHYEAQVIGAEGVDDAKVLAIEIGFHAEHPKVDANDAAIAPLLAARARWTKALGAMVVAGPFLGRADDWRRVSETWADPDLGDPDLAMDVAARLVDYIVALEPLRRSS